MKWIKYGRYNEKHQYIDDSDRIVGEIRGSEFEEDQGWNAFDKTVAPQVWLGRYVTLRAARRAVETHYAALPEQQAKAEDRG